MPIEIENAIIDSTHIGFEAHGIFSFNIGFQGESWGQGTGHMFAEDNLSRLVQGTLEAIDADRWEKLPGMFVRIKRENSRIIAIGHPLKDKWFTFVED
jgi:hypothetical protein